MDLWACYGPMALLLKWALYGTCGPSIKGAHFGSYGPFIIWAVWAFYKSAAQIIKKTLNYYFIL